MEGIQNTLKNYQDMISAAESSLPERDCLAGKIYSQLMTDEDSHKGLTDLEVLALKESHGHYNEQDVIAYKKLQDDIKSSSGKMICYYHHEIVGRNKIVCVLFSFHMGVSNGTIKFDHKTQTIRLGIDKSWNGMFEDRIEEDGIVQVVGSEKDLCEIEVVPFHNEFQDSILYQIPETIFQLKRQKGSEGVVIGDANIKEFFLSAQSLYLKDFKLIMQSYKEFLRQQSLPKLSIVK